MKITKEQAATLSLIRRNLLSSASIIQEALEIDEGEVDDFEGSAEEIAGCAKAMNEFLETCYTDDGEPKP